MIIQQTWALDEIEYLKNNYNNFSIKVLVEHFYNYFYVERSESSIRNKAFFMGLKRLDSNKRIT
jgi:hypothetical protein